MDPLTHALVGGVVAKTAKTSKRRFWIMMFLGEAPDLDVLFGGLGPWAFWLQHRGITHSLLGFVIQTVLYAWAFQRIDPGSFRERLWQYSLPIAFHLVCDYLTSYGVPLLAPFSFHEFAGDIMPAVTLIPVVFMLIGLFYMFRKEREGWAATHPVWTAWGIYLVFSLSGYAYATHLIDHDHKGAQVVSGRLNPFGWTAVVQKTTCGYEAYSVNVLNGKTTIGPKLTTAVNEFPIQASLESTAVKKFVATTRWPAARILPSADGWNVEWGRMIFSARGTVRGEMIVHVAPNGAVMEEGRAFDFWDSADHQTKPI